MAKTGTCLCGKVSVTVEEFHTEVSACHCSMCRKWTAGPMLSIHGGTAREVTIEPENAVTRYPSSEWAERGFCTTCGTSLFYHGIYDDTYYLPVDLFDDQEDAKLQLEIYYDEKPAYFDFANETKKVTGAEIAAQMQVEIGDQ